MIWQKVVTICVVFENVYSSRNENHKISSWREQASVKKVDIQSWAVALIWLHRNEIKDVNLRSNWCAVNRNGKSLVCGLGIKWCGGGERQHFILFEKKNARFKRTDDNGRKFWHEQSDPQSPFLWVRFSQLWSFIYNLYWKLREKRIWLSTIVNSFLSLRCLFHANLSFHKTIISRFAFIWLVF